MMKKMIKATLAASVVALLSIGSSILYYHLALPNGMTYVSIREYDQDAVRHAVLESIQEVGFQVVAESEQGDVFQIQRSDTEQSLVLNVQVSRQEDYFKISYARPRWMIFRSHDRNQMAEVGGDFLNRVCTKLNSSNSAKGMQAPSIDELNETVQKLGKSQS